MGRKPDKHPSGTTKLIDLPRLLKAEGLSVPYNECYLNAVNGDIPAVRSASGSRWLIHNRSLPKVIQHFSLLKEED